MSPEALDKLKMIVVELARSNLEIQALETKMKLTVVLAVLIGMLVVACSSAAPAPVEPTPNIDATVEARAREIVASQATSIPSPTNTSVPQPTKTPKPVPTATPTVVPTATSIPTPTPTALPTPTRSRPTWTPVPKRTPWPTHTPSPTPIPYTEVGGLLAADTTWVLGNSPYLIIEELLVPKGKTLTIEPGVHVTLEFPINASGGLKANGTKSQPITFTLSDSELLFRNFGVFPSLISSLRTENPERIEFSNIVINGVRLDQLAQFHIKVTDSHIKNVDNLQVVDASGNTFENIGGSFANLNEFKLGDTTLMWIRGDFRNNCLKNMLGIILMDAVTVENNTIHVEPALLNKLVTEIPAHAKFITPHYPPNNDPIDLADNYWGGVSDEAVEQFIYVNPETFTVANYLPTLDSPHIATPRCLN